MSTAADQSKPDFAASAATLRETVKWLAATFAALAAVVVGTGPISGLGAMPGGAARNWAVLFLVVGFVCICAALWITLRILRPETMYRSYLIDPETQGSVKGADERERLRLRKTVDAHAKDLLPHNYPTLDKLATALADVEKNLVNARELKDTQAREQALAKGTSTRDKLLGSAGRLLPLAIYLRLQQRLQRSLLPLFLLGILALLSLAAFGVSTHQEKPDKPVVINNQVNCPCDPVHPSARPELDPVLFDTGKALVSKEGLAAIQHARDELLKAPEAVLLIRAHTDTVASDAVNVALAENRASVVKELLRKQGGVPAGRLYVSPLPEQSLPQVTGDSTATQDNRTVRLQLALPVARSPVAK